jgi:hypothetical protein
MDSRGSDALNKASELYASKCELNVLLLVAAEPRITCCLNVWDPLSSIVEPILMQIHWL